MPEETNSTEPSNLAAAVEQAADGVVITDSEGRIEYVNPAFTAMSGYAVEELLGREPSILKSGHHPAAFYANLWTTVRSGEIWTGDVLNRRKDGTLYREEMRITPVRDADGSIARYIAFKRDVTERRAAEEAQGLLAAIVENSPDAIVVCTPAGVIRAWNRGAADVFGYSGPEVIGKHISLLEPPGGLNLSASLERASQGGAPSAQPAAAVCKDGRSIRVSATSSAIRDSAGRATALSLVLRDITEHQRTEGALRESEDRFRAVADSCPTMMWVTDEAGGNQFINQAYQKFCGIRHHQAEGDNWRALLHPEDASGYIEAFGRAVAARAPFREEARVRRGDGAWRWIASYAEPRVSANGEYLGHVGISLDITERKDAEHALESEAWLRRVLFSESRDGILVLTLDGRIVDANQAMAVMLGYAPDELRRLRIEDWDAQWTRDEALIQLRQLGAQPATFETLHRRKDGTIYPVEVSSNGATVGDQTLIFMVHRDITERKRAEAQLKEASDRLMLAARAGGVGIWDYDVVHNRTIWDNQVYRLYGTTRDQFSNADEAFRAVLHPDDRDRVNGQVRVSLESKPDYDTEFRVIWADGSIHTLRSTARVYRDPSGRPLRLIGTNWDVTAQKKAVEDLRESNRRLEEATARATELAAEAAAANAAKSAFLATMSHEIRTPMNAILGMIDVLSTTPLDDDQRKYVEAFRRSGDTLLTLLNDILDLSKIEAGQLILEKATFGLGGLAKDVLALFRPKAAGKALRLTLDLAPEADVCIRGDSARLRQILLNLLGNAVKFTAAGEVKLSVELDHAAGRVHFAVVDTGIGIPADKLAVIFDDFQQADSSTTRRFGGTGLGLGICRRLIEIMGGKITVESAPGRGSTFRFSIPFEPAPCEVMPHDQPGADASSRIEAANAHESLRILIAEDYEDNQTLIKAYLGPAGHTGTFVEDGLKAFEEAQQGTFDLILMDVRMPVMDGLTATAKIREWETAHRMPPVPILALTADAGPEDSERSRRAGCDGHLTKPIKRKTLLAAIERYAAAKRGGDTDRP